jgi:hypothetical protein
MPKALGNGDNGFLLSKCPIGSRNPPNAVAIGLYESCGFLEYERDDVSVYMVLVL